jgi:hypothetical protein
MGNGSSGLTPAQTWREFSVPSTQRSFTPPFRISLTRQKKSGLRRSQLKSLKKNGTHKRPARLVKTAGLSQLATKLWKKMIESVVPVVIALVTGTAVLFNRVNHRITLLDNKVDKLELKVVETYTPKQEFTAAMLRMEDHLIRIEDKMDQLVAKKCTT